MKDAVDLKKLQSASISQSDPSRSYDQPKQLFNRSKPSALSGSGKAALHVSGGLLYEFLGVDKDEIRDEIAREKRREVTRTTTTITHASLTTTVETITSTTAIACRQNQRRRRSANRSRGSEVLPKNAPSVIGKGPNVIRRRLAMSAALALKLGLTMALDTPLSLSSWPENSRSSADKVVGAAVPRRFLKSPTVTYY